MEFQLFKIKWIGALAGLVLCCSQYQAKCQDRALASTYRQRAEIMYANIWKSYRVPAHQNLLSEYFPSNHSGKLDYFQGSDVKEKEVCFLWPYSGMLSATNALMRDPALRLKYKVYLDSLVAGMETYKDTSRKPTGYQAYPATLEPSDRYYDDNGLVGTEYLEAYFNTKDPVYLNRAKTVFKFIISGWSDELGGGIYWLEGHHDQKPACSNGMALIVALKLYQATHDRYYLNWGFRFYNWMEANLRDDKGLIWNDKKVADKKINPTYWTYNTGAVLEGAVLLYNFTKNPVYLHEARFIAKNVYQHFSEAKHDPHLSMQIDLPWFVTVLVRGYEALYRVDHNYQYLGAISHDLDYAWVHNRDHYGFLTHSWTNNPEEIKKPKWLLDEACIAELYGRLSKLETERGH